MANTQLPPALIVLRGMVQAGAMETACGQRVESALWQSVVDSTQLPPAPSVPRGMEPPGATVTVPGQVDSVSPAWTSSGWGTTPWSTAATGPPGFQCQVSLSVTTDVNGAAEC